MSRDTPQFDEVHAIQFFRFLCISLSRMTESDVETMKYKKQTLCGPQRPHPCLQLHPWPGAGARTHQVSLQTVFPPRRWTASVSGHGRFLLLSLASVSIVFIEFIYLAARNYMDSPRCPDSSSRGGPDSYTHAQLSGLFKRGYFGG